MSAALLALNSGSSSIKFSLFALDSDPSRPTAFSKGQIEGLGGPAARFIVDESGGKTERPLDGPATHEHGLATLLAWFETAHAQHTLVAAGHRVVHGGTRFAAPVRVDESVLSALRDYTTLAPLHQRHNLAAISALLKLHPQLPQVACFDTAFHRSLPPLAATFALPRTYCDQGIRRYGFHGLSYEYIASVLPEVIGQELADKRVVVAHLGAGASMCAMRNRRSIATTMGFTALDGLMMGRRCGAIDPGVLLYLLQEKGMTAEQVSDLLYHRSGLIGVSGISDDMRTLLASKDPAAAFAIDLFVYRVQCELGSMAAALGGMDALIFTAGIGENAPDIRRRVCAGASWLGIELDEAANAKGGPCITRSVVSAWVVPTDEDSMIARHTLTLIGQ